MSKLRMQQRQELKALVANAIVRRLTGKETCAFVFEKLGVSITEEYVRHLRMNLKHDYASELKSLQMDRDAYIKCLFWDRVNELEYLSKVLHRIIDNNDDNPDVQIKAANVLHNISSSIFTEYSNLPAISRYSFPIPAQPEPEPLGPSPLNPSQPHPTELDQNEEPIL
jgi:hypothetical protein